MKKLAIAAIAAFALALAGVASAALSPSVFDPGKTGCPTATFSNGVLHLAKNCATTTNAAAGADITGVTGPFVSGSFTLASASQCQGGSPRFDVQTTTGLFFLGCNNVTPVVNADGTATYTFTAANLIPAVAGTTPGTVTAMDILVDVQGSADITHITVNGAVQVPASTGHGKECKHGGWKSFSSPGFKNQGQCVSHHRHEKKHENGEHDGHDRGSHRGHDHH